MKKEVNRLSSDALAVLYLIHYRGDDWDGFAASLTANTEVSMFKTKRALLELVAGRWLHAERPRDDAGQIIGPYQYSLIEEEAMRGVADS